jgi:hypothetical protein
MKRLFQFFDLFFRKLIKECVIYFALTLIFTAGFIFITLLWGHGLQGKMVPIVAAVVIIGMSAVESFFKVTSDKKDELSEAVDHYAESRLELKEMNKNKNQTMRWRFYQYLKDEQEKNNGKK